MYKYILYSSLTASLALSLVGAAGVSAQTTLKRFTTNVGVYAAAHVDQVTKRGTLTLSRTDSKWGLVLNDIAITPQTVFLKKYGGPSPLSDFHINENLSVYAERNPNGSLTALSVTDNDLWFLDAVIQNGLITAVDPSKQTLTVTDNSSGQVWSVTYGSATSVLKPGALPGTTANLVVGKNIRVRGVVRKVGTTTSIERANVIWILPEHGE